MSKNEVFSLDKIEERCPIDHLQTLPNNLHQSMDHSSERPLKLNPYLILDTDPILDSSNLSIALLKTHSLGKKLRTCY